MRHRTSAVLALPALIALNLSPAAAQGATPLCFGQPATIVGTAGADTLTGQSGVSDVIYGGDGNDRISGGAFYSDDDTQGTAPDLLCGGPGADVIKGGPGNDRINGGDGNDDIRGELGADVMQGNAGDDGLYDESFEDMDAANDILRGGSGADRITTAEGLDKAYGETGNDTITDTECSTSYLYGGPGADRFESWSSSFEGWHSSYCASPRDVINGNEDYDEATVSGTDSVTSVEKVVRVTSAP
jgi:Ca2+-binding RTX toxin-like protein